MSPPAGKHVGLEFRDLAARTEPFLMLDDGILCLAEYLAESETCKVN